LFINIPLYLVNRLLTFHPICFSRYARLKRTITASLPFLADKGDQHPQARLLSDPRADNDLHQSYQNYMANGTEKRIRTPIISIVLGRHE
jgi:hypothetical protein